MTDRAERLLANLPRHTAPAPRRREQQVLYLVLGILLLVTLLVSPLAFHDLGLLLLLAIPFALTLLTVVLVLPLAADRTAENAERSHAASVRAERRAEAARHAIRTNAVNTSPQEDTATLLAAMETATREHAIHFSCAHLRDEDFLQAFHAHEIRPADFRHGDHLRYTFLMLRRLPAGLAEQTISNHLRSYLRDVCGSEALFHATRTHTWFTVLSSAMQSQPRATFAALLQHHGNHLRKESLDRFYSQPLLDSDAARKSTIPPDREPLPQAPIQSKP